MTYQEIRAVAERVVMDYLAREMNPTYGGSIEAVAQDVDPSRLKRVYHDRYQSREPFSSLQVSLDDMARPFVDEVITVAYRRAYPHQDTRVVQGLIPTTSMFESLKRKAQEQRR